MLRAGSRPASWFRGLSLPLSPGRLLRRRCLLYARLIVALPLKPRPQPGDDLPLREGDVLAGAPHGTHAPFSVMTTVSLQRPHTGVWGIAAHELQLLEEWVRTTAISVLVTGSYEVSPLPPQLDIAIGHGELRGGLATAVPAPAVVRARDRIAAAVTRAGLVEAGAPSLDRLTSLTTRRSWNVPSAWDVYAANRMNWSRCVLS